MLASSPFSASWPKRQLGDLLTRIVKPLKVESSAEYREIGIRSHCKGIFHKSPVTGKQLGSKRVFWVEPGCLVLNIVFAWEQAVAVTSENERGMIASHRFPMYQSIDGKLLPEYACLYFSSPRGKYDLGLASPGGAGRNKTLGQEEFRRLEIPVPTPEYQQFAIRVMHTWDTAIAQTEKLIEAKRKLKKGLIQQLLTGKQRFPGFQGKMQRFEFDRIAKLSKERYDPKKSKMDLRCVELEHIAQVDGRLLGTTSSKKQSSVKAVFYKRDVLFGKLRPNLRKYFFCSFDGVCSTEIWVLKANRNICTDDYLYQLVQTNRFISTACATTGSKMPRADWEWVAEQTYDLPPIPAQQKIASVLSVLDREIEALKHLSNQLKEQKRGLMQKLLTGQIRVKATDVAHMIRTP